MVEECDGLLVVGSSLMVYSAFRLARAAAASGAQLALLSVGPTRADDLANIKVQTIRTISRFAASRVARWCAIVMTPAGNLWSSAVQGGLLSPYHVRDFPYIVPLFVRQACAGVDDLWCPMACDLVHMALHMTHAGAEPGRRDARSPGVRACAAAASRAMTHDAGPSHMHALPALLPQAGAESFVSPGFTCARPDRAPGCTKVVSLKTARLVTGHSLLLLETVSQSEANIVVPIG